MPGADSFLLSGGQGALGGLTYAPSAGGGTGSSLTSGMGAQPHHGAIGLVLLAVAVLFLLDRAGFRFAVTAGRR